MSNVLVPDIYLCVEVVVRVFSLDHVPDVLFPAVVVREYAATALQKKRVIKNL